MINKCVQSLGPEAAAASTGSSGASGLHAVIAQQAADKKDADAQLLGQTAQVHRPTHAHA